MKIGKTSLPTKLSFGQINGILEKHKIDIFVELWRRRISNNEPNKRRLTLKR